MPSSKRSYDSADSRESAAPRRGAVVKTARKPLARNPKWRSGASPTGPIDHLRTDEAIDAAVSTVVTACQYCMTVLSDGAKDRGDAFAALNLAEVLIRHASETRGEED